MPDWLATTLSVIAGGALTMVTSWLADRRLSERDRERRREDRRERLVDRANDFQRETLLALQVASQKLLRNTGASLHQDIMAYRTTGIWQKQQLPEGLSDDHLRLTTEVMLLASRIRDDRARALTECLRKLAAEVGLSSAEHEAQRRMQAAAEVQNSLLEKVGELVRELDALR